MNTDISTPSAAPNARAATTPPQSTSVVPVLAQPGTLLKIEGAVLFAGSVLLYAQNGGEWIIFLALLLVPDLSMLGYLRGPAVGGAIYNLFHNYLLPAALAAFYTSSGSRWALLLALIWFAHIGMDRLLGYGLKFSGGFKDTHLTRK